MDFEFEPSRDIGDADGKGQSKTDYVKAGPNGGGANPFMAGMTAGGDSLKNELSDELMNDMRGSVLMQGNMEEADKNSAPSLADFKMLVVLGKGTFGKVFLAEFNKNKKLYAVKVIRKDILIEYNQIKNTKLEKEIMFKC